VSWQALDQAIERARGEGRPPTFWWRDDDASEPTAAVNRLLALSQATAVPLALAVVPLTAVPALFERLAARVLMHGTDHRNRAASDEKKTEFAASEPPAQALGRLDAARARLAALAGLGLGGALAAVHFLQQVALYGPGSLLDWLLPRL